MEQLSRPTRATAEIERQAAIRQAETAGEVKALEPRGASGDDAPAPGAVPPEPLFSGACFFSPLPTAPGWDPLHPDFPASFFCGSALPAPD